MGRERGERERENGREWERMGENGREWERDINLYLGNTRGHS